MTNFIVYLIGTLLVVAGLAYAASRLGIAHVWIVAGALIIISPRPMIIKAPATIQT